jgi:hypothetical protein
MGMHYDSFVLRHWQLSDERQRIEVEHLQSGARTRVAALSAALDWIDAQCNQLTAAPDTGFRKEPTNATVFGHAQT